MKKLLFINGCVRANNSRTLKIARTYISKLNENNNYDVTERNLGSENLQHLDTLSFNSMTGEQKYKDNSSAREFAGADIIVIAAPFWEFMFPAAVSCYLESISSAGITFRYTEKGSAGLCKAEVLTYIYTAGDYLENNDKQSEKYLKRLSEFFGIEKFSALYADGLDIEGNNAELIIQKTCQSIKDNAIK